MWWKRLIRVILGGRFPKPPNPDPIPKPPDNDGSLVAEINRFRAENGRQPFAESPVLTAEAIRHASTMYRTDKLSHDGFLERLSKTGYSRGSENVAWGQRNPAEAVKDWSTSPGHRANMLGDWTVVGVGECGSYWCALFAGPV